MHRWFVALLSLAALGTSCKSAPPVAPAGEPQVASQELVIAEQGLTQFKVRLLGEVVSPTAATLEEASYELVVDQRVVKSGSQPLHLEMVPNAPGRFQIEQEAGYVSSAQELQAMNDRGGSMLVSVRGKVKARVQDRFLELPFARAREIRVPRLPSVKLHELDAARYAADEANATFYLGVVNPNPFPIRLAGLSYQLEVGGKQVGEGTRGAGEKVGAAATGVFELQVAVNQETHGKEVVKLIKSRTLPYLLRGELKGDLFNLPYELKGEIKLNESK